MEDAVIEWYKNPNVYIAFFTFLAIVLTQLPPVSTWFKKGKLELDIYSKGFLNHSLGNSLLQLHIILSNIGTKPIKVNKIYGKIYKDEEKISTLHVHSYIPNPINNNSLLLPKFNVQPNDEWSNTINFQNLLSREEEKVRRDISLIIQEEASKNQTPGSMEPITVKKKKIKPLKRMFEEKFIWEPSRYIVDIIIETNDTKLNISKKIEFTIFEIQSNELKNHKEGYTSGDMVYWSSGKYQGVHVDIEINEESK